VRRRLASPIPLSHRRPLSMPVNFEEVSEPPGSMPGSGKFVLSKGARPKRWAGSRKSRSQALFLGEDPLERSQMFDQVGDRLDAGGGQWRRSECHAPDPVVAHGR
jgi:hypothetical protein